MKAGYIFFLPSFSNGTTLREFVTGMFGPAGGPQYRLSVKTHCPRRRNMAGKNSVQGQNAVAAPEGFRRVGSVANAGWFNMKKVGNIVSGVLENMFERPDDKAPSKKSKFFQIRMGRGEETTVVMAKPGDTVNLNYGPKTKELENLISDIVQGAEYAVYGVVAGDKIKLTGGRSMHNIEMFTRCTRRPVVSDEPDFGGGDDADDAQA
jgi:hypothetical protein